MGELQIVTICLVGLLVLMLAGVPIAVSLIAAGAIGAWVISGNAKVATNLILLSASNVTSNYSLVVVPLFIFMGELSAIAGISGDLFSAFNKWLGRIPGGLAIATTFACAAFGAITGSSLSATVAMTRVCLPEMRKYGYSDEISSGVIASAGAFAIMIPPSIMLVVYGILAEQSIGRLLLAGVGPGVATAIVYAVLIYVRTLVNPNLAPRGGKFTLAEKGRSLVGMMPFLAIAGAILFGMLLGIWTPTEAAAIGTVGVAVVGLARKQMPMKDFMKSARDSVITSASVFIIVIGAYVFARFLALSGATQIISQAIVSLNLSSIGVFTLLVILYLILGCLMDGISMLALTLPIVLPIAIAQQWDLVWLGIQITLLVQVSLITPPVALNIFAMRATAPDIPMEKIIRGVLPYVVADLIMLYIIYFVPQIALLIPNFMKV